MFWNKPKPTVTKTELQEMIRETVNNELDNFFTEIKDLILPKTEIVSLEAEDVTPTEQAITKEEIRKHGGRKNTSGIYCVRLVGKRWQYRKQQKDNTIICYADSLTELEKKVKAAGYDWVILDKEKAQQSYNKNITKKSMTKCTSKNPDEQYVFPKSYCGSIRFKLFDNGLIGTSKNVKGQEDPQIFFRLFKTAEFPILNKQYTTLNQILKSNGISPYMGFSFLKQVQDQITQGNGYILEEILFPIYMNAYDVPFYINFERINENIMINGKDTGIRCKTLSEFFYELNNTVHPQSTIVKLMHDNQSLNQKYLFYCLMNYGNDMLNELL